MKIPPLRNWVVATLMALIAVGEWQRLDAQAKAHRERQDQTYRLVAIERKLDWLLLTTRLPIPSEPTPPPVAEASATAHGR